MRPSRLALPAILAGTALGIAAPAHAAPALLSVTSSTMIGPHECRGGDPSPQCDASGFDRSGDLAFSGNGSAQPAVAYDSIAGFPDIHKPAVANDGFYGNGSSWIGASAGSWVKIDLGRRMYIDRVQIGRDRTGGLDDRDPGRFTIATATGDNAYANGDDSNDDAEYTQQFDSQPFDPDVTFLTSETLEAQFDPVVARYVKVQVANYGAALDEIEVRGQPDTIAPELTPVANVTVDATSPNGAIATYTAPAATDEVDGTVSVACNPASGAPFAIGSTTVTCSATDAAGNTGTTTFTVLVRAAADQVSDLAAQIKTVNIKQGLANSIDAKLQDALAALTEAKQGDKTSTCGKLGSVDKQIQSQAVVKEITQTQADALSARVRQIRAVIGC